MNQSSPDDLPSLAELERRIRQQAKEIETLRHQISDDRISTRVAVLEKAILEQSTIVAALRQRAIESDMNLQRLISAVERLCERTDAGQGSTLPDLPFQSQLKDAINRQPEIPPPSFEPGFRPQLEKAAEEKPRRHRIPLTKL
jgi:hypothetical protein